MKHSKQLMTAGVLTATVLGGGIFAISASAATNSNGQSDGLAAKIATKFNLNKDDVQTVVNDYHQEKRTEHQAEMQTKLEERLTKAVSDGKITNEQKTKILDYLKGEVSFTESFKDKTDDERRTAMETHRQEVKKWASDNGIDEQYVLFGGGKGHHMGPRGGEHNE